MSPPSATSGRGTATSTGSPRPITRSIAPSIAPKRILSQPTIFRILEMRKQRMALKDEIYGLLSRPETVPDAVP